MTDLHSPLKALGHHTAKHTETERQDIGSFGEAFESAIIPLAQRLQNFPRHVRRQDVSRFLAKYELFKLSISAHGNIVECGVFAGGGIASWHHFTSILEPYNHNRKIVGFDTFSGFPSIDAKDTIHGQSDHLHKGAFLIKDGVQSEIEKLVELHDRNRPLGHISKVELIAGDACETIPKYVDSHPSLLISLLYLDFDIYSPTVTALQHLYPRIVKGGIVAFDELNCEEFPGETSALTEFLDLTKVELKRFPLDPHISYFMKS